MPDFYAFESTLRNGAFVAVGDLTGAGHADLIFGGGPGGGPRVRVADPAALAAAGGVVTLDDPAAQPAQLANFFAGDPNARGGVRVAGKDPTGATRDSLLVGSGAGDGSHVTEYAGTSISSSGTPSAALDFDAFPGFTGGVFVG
jgi:hypothetical protein